MGSLLAVFLLGSAPLLHADEAQPAAGDPAPEMGKDHGMEEGAMGMGRLDKMKEKLGLTDSQAAKVKDLFKQQRESNKPLRDQMKIDMDTLQQKVDAKASDSELKDLLDKLQKDRESVESARKKMVDGMRDILTPTQQAKMVLSMKGKGRQMMGKWRHKMKKDNDGNKDDGAGKGI
jgi:Spy/CpxP family protein refolding chaperone